MNRARMVVLAMAALVMIAAGCGEPVDQQSPPADVVYFDRATKKPVVAAAANELPAAHPVTGKRTLVPALYCRKCRKWRPAPPVEQQQRDPAARRLSAAQDSYDHRRTATAMTFPGPILMCFSGGKDSALALAELRRRDEFEVVALLTTVTDAYDRVSMHGVRRSLLRQQAASLGLPLTEVVVPPKSSNEVYEREMAKAFRRFHAEGLRRVAFGDIFLEDLREYREQQFAACGLTCEFPIWQRDTRDLANHFIDEGFEATLVCINPQVLDRSFAGRRFDRDLLNDLPADCDPCGENGEFHTFVSNGPIFREPIPVSPGEVVERDGFVFCDLTCKNHLEAVV